MKTFRRSAWFAPFAVLFAIVLAAAPAAKADITINGTSYTKGVNLGSGTYTVTGTGNANNRLIVTKDCTIVLDGVSFAPTANLTTGILSKKYYGYPAIFVTNGVTATIRLKGANTITPSSTKGNQTGLYVGKGAAVHITNLTETASLKIDASSYSGNVGIGGWAGENVSGGVVTFWGGTIVAKGGENGAGIGGANGGTGATVTNWNANVTATGGKDGAGIGGGNTGAGGTVEIYGGSVTATGAQNGAGIGGGNTGAGGTVEIYGGSVTASSAKYGAGIGGGYQGAGGIVRVYGGTVTATGGAGAAGIGGGRNGAGGTFRIDGGRATATGG
ncbi:MAG: hypothetical protein IJ802_01930 [Kiritimatiellae bacterium]|nr:hypothetical protein [Kiritimatiellia bacterium]